MRVLQCLNWDLKVIRENLKKVKEQGFDVVQITPVQPLKEGHKDSWWMSYQPCGFSIGNQYGSKEDLIDLCNSAHNEGLKVVVDVICTHMAQNGEMKPHELVDKSLINNEYFWREKRNLKGDWEYNNRYNVTHYCAGNLPYLNLYNWDLQDRITKFLNECISCGIDGFRFDSGKSIPLPTDNFYEEQKKRLSDARGCDFFPRVLSRLDKDNLINYIEVLNVGPELIQAYSKQAKVLTDVEYDFLNKNDLVTFAESHDQYFNWRPGVVSPLVDKKVSEMYKNKCSVFPNTLYYARPFSNEWQSELVKEGNKTKTLRR